MSFLLRFIFIAQTVQLSRLLVDFHRVLPANPLKQEKSPHIHAGGTISLTYHLLMIVVIYYCSVSVLLRSHFVVRFYFEYCCGDHFAQL